METNTLHKFWPLIHATLREFWALTEPLLEAEALQLNIPLELYYYSEFGLEYFSAADFRERDPFTNPEQFETQFARLQIKGWIFPDDGEGGRYQVSPEAREAVLRIVRAGDAGLKSFEEKTQLPLERLLALLKRINAANLAAAEPPRKWALENRFHVATRISPISVQIREALMDLLAYHDDAHLTATRPHFNRAGIVWMAFGAVHGGSANTAEKIAEALSFRGYRINDYAVALLAAVQIGWLEETALAGTYRSTPLGRELREQVEQLTDQYFYRPWSIFTSAELDEFYDLLSALREQLREIKKTR